MVASVVETGADNGHIYAAYTNFATKKSTIVEVSRVDGSQTQLTADDSGIQQPSAMVWDDQRQVRPSNQD
jgi:hypothetical protein